MDELLAQDRSRLGLSVPADQFSRPAPLASEKALQSQPPLTVAAKAAGLEGHLPQSYIRQRIDLVKWAKTAQVQQAWKAMAEKQGLDASAPDKASWAFAGFL
ncbi:hypothetical protein SGCOL_002831 [Colletotrichum sp. CLE4]